MIRKVCGMRQPHNIQQVEALGIDWMGFICWPKSSRYVDQVPTYLPTHCQRVGVFVNPTFEWIEQCVSKLGLNIIQLHGHETPEFCKMVCQQFPFMKVMKAISVAEKDDLKVCTDYEDCCHFLLFDTKCPAYGGSGQQFNWNILQHYHGTLPFLLSGGISADSIESLQHFSHPLWKGIDVNSRFETEPALKDVALLGHFFEAITKTPFKERMA